MYAYLLFYARIKVVPNGAIAWLPYTPVRHYQKVQEKRASDLRQKYYYIKSLKTETSRKIALAQKSQIKTETSRKITLHRRLRKLGQYEKSFLH